MKNLSQSMAFRSITRSACVLLMMVLTIKSAFPQAPGGFTYQAVLRDASGTVKANTDVSLTLTLLRGSVTGSVIYSETHEARTNGFGLITLEIGSKSPDGLFGIDWTDGPVYVKTEVDGIDMGTSVMLSVPYALYALKSGTADENDPVFTHHPSNDISSTGISQWNTAYGWGDHGAAGYASGTHNHSASAITSGTLPASRGGTGISSFTAGNYLSAGGTTTLQQRTPAQVLSDIGAAESSHTHASMCTGSGYAGKLAYWTDTRNLSYDNSMHWDNSTGRLGIGTSSPGRMLDVTEDIEVNTLRIGRGGGNDASNTTVGIAALSLNTSGTNNTAFGYGALFLNTDGVRNTANGYQALAENTSGDYNTACGYMALKSNSTGNKNCAIGNDALTGNKEGIGNTAAGIAALNDNTSGDYNVAVGHWALGSNTTGNNNVAVGNQALYQNSSGENNVVVGDDAGMFITGSNNVVIGSGAGVPASAGSNQVRIGNIAVTYAGVEVAWDITSDIRKKESVRKLAYGIEFVSHLKPVDYIRRNNESRTREVGFIAQDVEVLLKEAGINDYGLLNKDDNGFLELRYNDFIPILTRAIQEQQQEIEMLKEEIRILKSMVLRTAEK